MIKRIYFSFTSSVNRSFSGYSAQAIEPNVLYNVSVSLNLNAVEGEKIKIYINGQQSGVTVLSIVDSPQNLNFKNDNFIQLKNCYKFTKIINIFE